MKKKVLLTSIVVIILCMSLIAGSTFALFTSSDDVNIAVTAGNVNVVAGIAITKLESVKGDVNGSIVDENGNTYIHEEVSPTFTNGGTAEIIDSVLTLEKVTPGDKVTFAISGTNNSNVAIKYRYVIDCLEGTKLMNGLIFTVNGVAVAPYMETYTSAWYPLAVGADMTNVPISVELPVSAGNEFQNQSTKIRVLIEAVQGNAVVEDNTDPIITYSNTAATADELAEILADPNVAEVVLTADIAEQITVGSISDKIINANGKVANLLFTGAINNVVVTGIKDDGDATPPVRFSGATGNITIKDSELFDHNSQPFGAIAGGNADLAITIDNCDISGYYAAYYSGAIKSLTVTNSRIHDTGSWALMYNHAIYGDVVIDGCTFTNCKGIFKALYAISGDFTFRNNQLVDCETKKSGSGPYLYVDAKVDGDIIVAGNTMVVGGVQTDDDVTAADLLGVVKN